MEVAKTVGIKSIAVTWGFATEEKLRSHNPDFIVHDAEELEKVLI
jgi:phosphoglycolate phosphatase